MSEEECASLRFSPREPGKANRERPRGSWLAAASLPGDSLEDLAEAINRIVRGWMNVLGAGSTGPRWIPSSNASTPT